MKASLAVVELLEAEGYLDPRAVERTARLVYQLDELLAEELEAAHRRGILDYLDGTSPA